MTDNGLSITRGIVIEGGHYDTEVEVSDVAPDDDSAIAVTLSQAGDAPGQTEPDVIALSWSEWDAVEDHISTVKAIYHNPDRDTPAYDTDKAEGPELPPFTLPASLGFLVKLRGGGAGTADGPGDPGSITLEPARAENDAAATEHTCGQCWARDKERGFCWLPEGHKPVRWRTVGNTAQHIAGHITRDGELFWEGV